MKKITLPVTHGATLHPAPTQASTARSKVIFRWVVRVVGFENAPPHARQPGGEAGESYSVQCGVGRK